MKNLYSAKEAARIAGITYRQLDHWCSSEMIEPEVQKAHGKGTRRLFSYYNLVELKLIKKLNEAGVSIQRIGHGFLNELLDAEAPRETILASRLRGRFYGVWIDKQNKLIKIDFDEILNEIEEEMPEEARPEAAKTHKISATGVPRFEPVKVKNRKQA